MATNGSLYPELDQLPLEALCDRFLGSPPAGEADGALYFEEIARRIAAYGDAGMMFLNGHWSAGDEPRTRALIVTLTLSGECSAALCRRLRARLRDTRPMIVMAAIDGLARIGDLEALGDVKALGSHPSGHVRGAVLRYLRALTGTSAFALLIDAINDPDFVVRESAADELGELADPAALPALRRLLADSHPDVRMAAATAIAMLEGGSEEQ